MNNIIIKNEITIENLIYEVRGKQVMLDSDLALLYGTETKRINEGVSRNKEKFPDRFCFKISENEYNTLKSQFATSKGGSRKGHKVFTEQGVAMLATILKIPIATQTSIKIMDAFVAMRKYISTNLIEQRYINELVIKDSKRIDLLEETFSRFKETTNEIYFDGQIYDAYSKLVDIMSRAQEELIIIDSYADKRVLDMIAKVNCKVFLICKKNGLLKEIDITKYNSQYHNLTIIYNDTFHDRYFILDREVLFHCGTSMNHAGMRTFSVNKIEDQFVMKSLINRVAKLIS